MRENTLVAQPFNASTLRFTGEPVPVAENVTFNSGTAQGQFSVSQNGMLLYSSGGDENQSRLTWMDRTGKPSGAVGEGSYVAEPSLSPDGSRVAYSVIDGAGIRDIWLRDLSRGAASRFTFGPDNRYPVWSADGNAIAWTARKDSKYVIVEKSSSGVGLEHVIDEATTALKLNWSSDGRWRIETRADPKTQSDIWVVPTAGDQKPFPYLNTAFNEQMPRLAPDGRFLTYTSNESRRDEVYIQTFPSRGGKWQISSNGGLYPTWSRDGRELYFIDLYSLELMAVEVKTDGAKFEAGLPKPLFRMQRPIAFDVSKDGRFLIPLSDTSPATNVPLTLVTNWQAALKQ